MSASMGQHGVSMVGQQLSMCTTALPTVRGTVTKSPQAAAFNIAEVQNPAAGTAVLSKTRAAHMKMAPHSSPSLPHPCRKLMC